MNRFLIASLIAAAGLSVCASAQTVTTFQALGGDAFGVFADLNGVSKDGTVLAGRTTSTGNVNGGPAYIVRADGFFVEVGGTIGADLNAANADGSLLVGARGTSLQNNQGVLHIRATGTNITLSDLPGGTNQQSSGFAISDTGSRIVGFTTPTVASVTTSTPVRWEYTVGTTPASLTPQVISMPSGVPFTGAFARGLSGNGQIVAGFLRRGSAPSNPAAWVNVNGGTGASTILPALTGGLNDNGEAYGVASDGGTIVGWSTSGAGTPAVKWTGSGATWTPTALALRPGSTSARGYSSSADASRIVGESIAGFVSEAVLWQGNSVVSIAEAVVAAGGSVPPGVTLVAATGISADGTVIVGDADIDGADGVFVVTLPAMNACPNPSNVAGPGQNTVTIDEELTADDIIVFLNRFFAGDALSNVSGPGQNTVELDNELTADDIIVFLNRFFAGC